MRFVYPAQLCQHAEDEIVVSFRDVPHCHTSGEDVAEALIEAADALEEAIAGCIVDGDEIPTPSPPLPGEHLVAVHADTAAKAALAMAFRASGLTQADLAKRLGVHDRVVRRMLDPRHGTSVSRVNDALQVLGRELVLEVREVSAQAELATSVPGS